MRISVTIGQIPVGWDLARNVRHIGDIVSTAAPDDLVVLPEGAISGYDPDLTPLATLDRAALADAVEQVAALARQHAVHVFCGSLLPEHDGWCNALLHFAPDGGRWTYRKVNLAMNERGVLRAGAELPTAPVRLAAGTVTVGGQLCREIRFPEQWQYLARAGAEAFVYATNAATRTEPADVWRSHLISRAAENQRFVLAANAAHPDQHCPSMVVSPRGEVLAELPAGGTARARLTVDLAEVSDWYLGQQRRDVVELRYRPESAVQAF